MSDSTVTTIDAATARAALPPRADGSHKWEVGCTLVVAGSPVYPGAALLASRAAGRAGAGIVLLATSRGVIAAIAGSIPEVAFVPLPETESLSGTRGAVAAIEERLPNVRSVVVGPGLGTDDAASSLLTALFGSGERSSGPLSRIGFGSTPVSGGDAGFDGTTGPILSRDDLSVVVDADALTWLAGQGEWWSRVPKGRLLLTPHPGEMAKLLQNDPDEVLKNPAEMVRAAAAHWNQTVVLKGSPSHVSDGTQTFAAAEAPGSLATAGSGDVLSGILGGLLAQRATPIQAAVAALWVGPAAARRLETRYGASGVIATDLADTCAEAFAELARHEES